MPAAKDERARAVEGVEQGEPLRAGRSDNERRDQEKHREENEREATAQRVDRKIQMPGNWRCFSLAEPKARARAKRNRCDLPERPGKNYNDRNRGKRDTSAGSIGREGSRHARDGLCHDRDGDELESVQETFGDRSSECGCAHGKGEQDQGRGHGEGKPRSKATQQPIAAQGTKGKADLAGGWSRKKLTERDQISIGGLVE